MGLMQLMPETVIGLAYNQSHRHPKTSGLAFNFCKWLDERMKPRVEDPAERLKFVLASYNVGIGHVLDAMLLAEKNGKNPQIWDDNVDYYILNKSNPK